MFIWCMITVSFMIYDVTTFILIYSCDMARDANYPFAYSKYEGQLVETKVDIQFTRIALYK